MCVCVCLFYSNIKIETENKEMCLKPVKALAVKEVQGAALEEPQEEMTLPLSPTQPEAGRIFIYMLS